MLFRSDYDKARELDPKYVNMTTALENQELEQNERAKLIDTTSIIQEQEQDEEPVYAPLSTAIGLDYGYGYGIANAPVATVGSQAWLGKNLNVDHFANGDPIPEAKTDEEWKRASENKQPAWCLSSSA